jgi:lipopolysaccharide/colanic/teichoic acid biosynthesis glycosyltransferase
VVKRLVDVSVAWCLLLLSLPLLLAAALLILLTSPGPVLFRQVRMGRDYQPFEILKLRTMFRDIAGPVFTLGPDARITPVGRVLRRTKLDELPQLWNVIRGDMSLVGPRPVLPELTYEFRESYMELLRVRPGITDPASLKYSREAEFVERADDPYRFFKTVVTPDKTRMSLEYMDRATVWTDLAMMAMTVLVCCFPALGRRYGAMPELPQHASARVVVEPPVIAVMAGLAASADGMAFSYQQAVLEAETKEGIAVVDLPWIRLPNSEFEPRSAPVAADGGVSRL